MGASHDQRDIAHAALGILGNVASCLFFLSSAPTIVNIVKCKSTGGISGDLYVFKLFNCMLWCLYGIPYVHPHDVWVVLTNSFGCGFATIYIIVYLCFATTKEKISLLWKLCVVITSFIALVVLLVLLSKDQQQRILAVGTISAIVSSVMHITLLSQCRMAFQSKDKKFLHPNASIAAFFKGAIWTAYGIENLDVFILIPNGVGVIIGMVQVVMVLFILNNQSLTKEDSFHQEIQQNNPLQDPIPSCKDLEEGSLAISSRVENSSLPKVTRVSSLIGLPKQGSISSSVVVPITSMDTDDLALGTH